MEECFEIKIDQSLNVPPSFLIESTFNRVILNSGVQGRVRLYYMQMVLTPMQNYENGNFDKYSKIIFRSNGSI